MSTAFDNARQGRGTRTVLTERSTTVWTLQRKGFVVKRVVVVALTFLSVAAGHARAVEIYDLAAQFDPDHNPSAVGNWTYGYADAPGGPLQPFTTRFQTSDFATWTTPSRSPDVRKNITGRNYTYYNSGCGLDYVHKDGVALFSAYDQFAIVRWTAPHSGTFSLDATFAGYSSQSGWSSQLSIQRGTTLIYSRSTVGLKSRRFSTTLVLSAGEAIDFGCGGNGMVLDATLTATPSPSSLVGLLSLGGAAVVGYVLRWRRD